MNQVDATRLATARLLVVDDEPRIRSALVRALSLVGYSATEAASGQEALALLAESAYELMILDMMMPGINGVEVMRQARALQPELLIIVLTGHANLENAIAAVKAHASDYLLKPANIRDIVDAVAKALKERPTYGQREELLQLMDRALQVLQRPAMMPESAQPRSIEPERYVIAYPLKLDRQHRSVTRLGEPDTEIELTKGETAVLANLMSHPNQVRSCLQLVQAVWGYEVEKNEAESLIRPYISRLRSKLAIDPKAPTLIRTIRGVGYLFASESE